MGDLSGLCELRGRRPEGKGCTLIDGLKHCAKRSKPRDGKVIGLCTTADVDAMVEPVISGSGGGTIPNVGNFIAPNSGTAPLGIYGARRVISTYNGPLYTVRRTNDNATMDAVVIAGGSNLPDYTAMEAFRGAADLYVTQVFDQFGIASPLSQGTAAQQPRIEPLQAVRYPQGAPFIMNAYNNATGSMSAGGFNFNMQNISYLIVGELSTSAQTSPLINIEDGAGVVKQAFYPASNAGRLTVFEAAATYPTTNAYCRSNPSVIALTCTAVERRMFFRETNEAISAAAAGTATNLRVGINATITNIPCWKVWCWAVYPALATADMNTLIASAVLACSIPTVFDRRIVIAGDSISVGHQNSVYLRNPLYYLTGLNGSPEIINRGIGGSTLAQLDTNYASGTDAAGLVRFYTAAYGAGKCILVVQRATNDIAAGTTGAASYTLASSIVTKAKATGFKVALSTYVSRGGTMDTTKQAERVSYNDAVTANTAGADFIVPFASDALMGGPTDYNNATYFSGDLTHPVDAGYQRIGAIYVSALNANVP